MKGIDLPVVGVILMIVGVVGALASPKRPRAGLEDETALPSQIVLPTTKLIESALVRMIGGYPSLDAFGRSPGQALASVSAVRLWAAINGQQRL